MAVVAFVTLIVGLAVFQAALVLGAPLGKYAWGGEHPGVLPLKLRIGSGVSLILYTVFALIVLDRSGSITLFPEGVSRVGIWVVVGILALSVLANLASRSKPERLVMAPLAAMLAVLAGIIALQA